APELQLASRQRGRAEDVPTLVGAALAHVEDGVRRVRAHQIGEGVRRQHGAILPLIGRSQEEAMGLVQDFAKAFNACDVDGLLACFTERASYTDNFFGEHQGRDGLRAMFAPMCREGRDYAWRMDTIVETPTAAAAEWTFSYVVTDAVSRSAGRKVRFRGMSVFELEGGRIARYREYFDTGVALLQLGFTPEGIAKVLGRRVG